MAEGWDNWFDLKRGSSAHSGSGRPEPLNYLVPLLIVCFLAAIGVLGWQIYSFLRFGTWPALSIVVVLQALQLDWARAPRDWVGLHELLDAMPLSVVAFLVGIVPISVWLWRDGRSDRGKPIDWGE